MSVVCIPCPWCQAVARLDCKIGPAGQEWNATVAPVEALYAIAHDRKQCERCLRPFEVRVRVFAHASAITDSALT